VRRESIEEESAFGEGFVDEGELALL